MFLNSLLSHSKSKTSFRSHYVTSFYCLLGKNISLLLFKLWYLFSFVSCFVQVWFCTTWFFFKLLLFSYIFWKIPQMYLVFILIVISKLHVQNYTKIHHLITNASELILSYLTFPTTLHLPWAMPACGPIICPESYTTPWCWLRYSSDCYNDFHVLLKLRIFFTLLLILASIL